MSKSEILRRINSIYTTRRAQSEYDFDRRLNAAFKDKKFEELYVAQKKASLAKLNDKNDTTIKAFQAASKALYDYIIENNIDLKNYYECNDCKDTGSVGGKMCHCKQSLLYSMLKAEANLPSFATNTFENTSFDNISCKQAKKMASISHDTQKWASNLDGASKRVVFLYGGVGIGKTTLAFCIANEALKNFNSVYYSSAYDFTRMLIDKQFNRLDNDAPYYDMLEADLLIIDDLGSESSNTLAIEQLFAILDSRINNNKKTMILSNLTLEQFSKRYGERSLSRLTSKAFSYAPQYIAGDDIRKIKC